MIQTKFIKIGLVSSVLTMFGAGAALAADAQIDTTGPSSQNTVTVSETTSTTIENTNHIVVNNDNNQHSSTGDANVSGNTNGGSATTGDATNTATTSTTVTVGNAGGGSGGAGGAGGGTLPGGGNPGSGAAGGGSLPTATTTGGSGGAGGGTLETLPNTGPLNPIDVSALRALWNPNSSTVPTQNTVNPKGVSTGMLLLAGLLTLVGAAGSITYAARRTVRA
jgi:hypothetical protein